MKLVLVLVTLLCAIHIANASSTTLSTTMSGTFNTPVALEIVFSKPTGEKSVTAHFKHAAAMPDTAYVCIDIDDAIPAGYTPDLDGDDHFIGYIPIEAEGIGMDAVLWITEDTGSYYMSICSNLLGDGIPGGSVIGPFNSAVSWNTA